jgi:hypothetical protein
MRRLPPGESRTSALGSEAPPSAAADTSSGASRQPAGIGMLANYWLWLTTGFGLGRK